MGTIISNVKNFSEPWKYSPTFCQKAQELTKEKREFSSDHDPIPVRYCCNVPRVLCQVLPFLPKSKIVCRICCFPDLSMSFCLCVIPWVPRRTSCLGRPWPWLQWELLPLTDSSSWTHPTAWDVSFEVWGHRDTHRRVRLCLQQPWNLLSACCGWLWMVNVQHQENRLRRGALFKGWQQKHPCALRKRRRESKAS